MIRCRTWGDRSNNAVCRFCRHQALSTRRSWTPIVALRRNYSDDSKPSTASAGLPGGWNRTGASSAVPPRPVPKGPAAGWAQSSWATPKAASAEVNGENFGNTNGGAPVDDGLLPHERTARQRLNVAPPPEPTPEPFHQRKSHHERIREQGHNREAVARGPVADTRSPFERGALGLRSAKPGLEGVQKPGATGKPHSRSGLPGLGPREPKPPGFSPPGRHDRPHERQDHGRRGLAEHSQRPWESAPRSSGSRPAQQPSQQPPQQSVPFGGVASKEKGDGWGLLKRKNAPAPVEEPAWKAPPSLRQSTSTQQGGGDAFWERFKSHVNDGENSKRKQRNTSEMTADQAAMWDSLEEESKDSKQQNQQPNPLGRPPLARNEIAEEKPQSRKSTPYDESFQINRDARKRGGKFARAYDDKRSKKGPSGRRSSRANDEDDEGLDEEGERRAEERRLRKAERKAQRQLNSMEAQEPAGAPKIFLPEFINLWNLAGGLKMKAEHLLAALEEMGFENITEDSIFTGETAALIAMEFGFEPTVDTGGKRDLVPRPVPEDASKIPQRPPVVTIMGHVDHGKTTLLDWLRKSSVAAQEHGGITQHIGAFVVEMSSGKRITFLDTPGHAAFLTMRQRGAIVTDIVVLVVAADDSVKPQTLEALKHARAAKVPMIVAINKVDKDDARPDQVKSDLGRHGVEIEDFGGDVQVVLVSGKTGQGMADLEENVTTLSEILDVRAEADGMAEGWILEASVKQIGKSASVLVKRGTLRVGDCIVAGTAWARVRVLRNEAGVELQEAPPGTPVEVIGWRDELPQAGDQVLQAPDEDRARSAVDYREEMRYREESSRQLVEQEREKREAAEAAAIAAEAGEQGQGQEVSAAAAEGSSSETAGTTGTKLINFTVKADVVGSVEAVCATIQELGNHEVRARILRSSAGQISEFDVDHAATSGSVIVNFNNAVPAQIQRLADLQGVRVLDHTIIYRLHDEVRQALSDHLPDAVSHKVVGEAEILQVFPINVRGRMYRNIAGCRVRNGLVKKAADVRVLRGGKKIFEGKIDALKRGKKDTSEMRKGSECGVSFEAFEAFAAGDQIQTYEVVREKRSL